MHDSKIRSRLKAQLTKFCVELCVGLSRPLEKFACQMLFGIQASQDVKLSNIARSLKEDIPLIETEKRLSRNLKAEELERELTPQLVRMGSQRVRPNTVLALDLSDIRKEYAQKMEYLATVRDGSSGELHQDIGCATSRRPRSMGARLCRCTRNCTRPRRRIFAAKTTRCWRPWISSGAIPKGAGSG